MKNLTTMIVSLGVLVVSCWAESRPNIIVIYADDIGYGDFSCYGGTGVNTPNVDKLAKDGIRFLSAYSSAATCTPSRYSLLTGSYAFRNGEARILKGNAPLIIDTNEMTVASMLKKDGYRTGLVGKWHLGLGRADESLDWNGDIAPGPKEIGFEYSFHIAATNDRVPSVYIENGRIVGLNANDPVEVSYASPLTVGARGISDPELLTMQADLQHSGTIVNGISRIGTMSGGHSARFRDEEMADEFLGKALGFLRQSDGTPFFLYYATHQNHVPRRPHPRFEGSSGLGPRGDAIVEFDWNIGQLLKELDRLDLRDDTLIILTSDNGPVLFDGYWDGAVEQNGEHKPAGPFRGTKYSIWEGGTRMPFIASWPNRIEPGVSDAIISQVDLMGSLAALLGIDCEIPVDSWDLHEALLGKDPHGRDYVVEEALGEIAVRTRVWKFIPPGTITERIEPERLKKTSVSEPGFLFNLREDPGETQNLASEYPKIVKKMHRIVESTLVKRKLGKTVNGQLGFE